MVTKKTLKIVGIIESTVHNETLSRLPKGVMGSLEEGKKGGNSNAAQSLNAVYAKGTFRSDRGDHFTARCFTDLLTNTLSVQPLLS